jgi:cytochrome b561
MGYLAKIVHWGLYVGLALVVVFGIFDAWARGDSFFGLHISKLYPGNPRLKPSVEYFHKTSANAVMILAAAHALAAVGHYYVLRDRVLQRMLSASRIKRGDL